MQHDHVSIYSDGFSGPFADDLAATSSTDGSLFHGYVEYGWMSFRALATRTTLCPL